jgi:hypothetical protein
MAASALALRAVLDGDRPADRPVRPGDVLAGGAQGPAAGGERARTDHCTGAVPRQQPPVAPAGAGPHPSRRRGSIPCWQCRRADGKAQWTGSGPGRLCKAPTSWCARSSVWTRCVNTRPVCHLPIGCRRPASWRWRGSPPQPRPRRSPVCPRNAVPPPSWRSSGHWRRAPRMT